MNITITPNTTPINAGVLAPVAKSFASGSEGGGGGGGGNIYPDAYNMGGAALPAPVSVPSNAEVDLAAFNLNFTGGKKALFLGFATLVGAVINAKFRMYVDGVKVSEATLSAGQAVSWGVYLTTTAGVKAVKISVLNLGADPLPVNEAETTLMEFLNI